MSRFEPVIGLEIHAQLSTRSKLFCPCSTHFGDPANRNTCPICLGLPGVLPVLNRHAVSAAIQAALALHCTIHQESVFARKNYFYPDLPKGYQISQFDRPLAEQGYLELATNDGQPSRIGITRVHLEEDAGKLLHGSDAAAGGDSLVDFNRSSVPLIEIVGEPDLRSPAQAAHYLKSLHALLVALGISDGNMEEGNLRCDANISLRPQGETKLGIKTEIKNVNSFRFVQRALEYEIVRQEKILQDGGQIIHETRLFDTAAGKTRPMRSKEEAHDYRYFPEPDLIRLRIDKQWIEKLRSELPELPQQKAQRLTQQYKLTAYDASLLVQSRELADYFEQTAKLAPDAKLAANWILSEVLRVSSAEEIANFSMTPPQLAELLALINNGTISGKIGKTVFEEMVSSGKSAESIVKQKGLQQVSDSGAIEAIIAQVLADNTEKVTQYKAGKQQLFGYFVGQVMQKSKGKANPKLVNECLKKKLS